MYPLLDDHVWQPKGCVGGDAEGHEFGSFLVVFSLLCQLVVFSLTCQTCQESYPLVDAVNCCELLCKISISSTAVLHRFAHIFDFAIFFGIQKFCEIAGCWVEYSMGYCNGCKSSDLEQTSSWKPKYVFQVYTWYPSPSRLTRSDFPKPWQCWLGQGELVHSSEGDSNSQDCEFRFESIGTICARFDCIFWSQFDITQWAPSRSRWCRSSACGLLLVEETSDRCILLQISWMGCPDDTFVEFRVWFVLVLFDFAYLVYATAVLGGWGKTCFPCFICWLSCLYELHFFQPWRGRCGVGGDVITFLELVFMFAK